MKSFYHLRFNVISLVTLGLITALAAAALVLGYTTPKMPVPIYVCPKGAVCVFPKTMSGNGP